jgi:hypothetical protein
MTLIDCDNVSERNPEYSATYLIISHNKINKLAKKGFLGEWLAVVSTGCTLALRCSETRISLLCHGLRQLICPPLFLAQAHVFIEMHILKMDTKSGVAAVR